MGLNDLKGVIPALATPLTDNEEIDEKALRKIVKRVIAAGVHGVLVLGSSGEGVMLNQKERNRAVEVVVDEVKGRVPVIVGTGGINTKNVKENNKMAAGCGANYALVVPPFYFHLRQEDIKEFYLEVAAASAIPILIYNIPQNTKINVALETIETLSKNGNIVGIKDSSGDWDYFQQLVFKYQNEEFKVFAGKANILYSGLLIGASGSITPVPNICPEIEVELYNCILSNDLVRARELQKKALEIASLFKYSVLPVSVKLIAALEIMGICKNVLIKPLPRASKEEINILKDKLKELAIL